MNYRATVSEDGREGLKVTLFGPGQAYVALRQ
jgi:hypothetical protein